MSNVLKILGVVFLVLIVAFVGLMVWSHQKGASTQEDFYTTVGGSDPQAVLAMFDSRLQEKVDAPVLAVWMAAVREHLGPFKGLAKSNFSTSASTTNGQSRLESSGRVEFEKGEGDSKLVYLDGKIISFELRADALPLAWLSKAPEGDVYRQRARDLLAALLRGDEATALAAMHENLRKQVEGGGGFAGAARLGEQLGAVEDMAVVEEVFSAEHPPSLDVRFTIVGASGRATGRVGFQFTPWRGEILSFDLKPAP